MSDRLHFKRSTDGVFVGPENSASDALELQIIQLAPGDSKAGVAEGKETVMVVMGGRIDIEAEHLDKKGFGERANVFDGRAHSVFLPPMTEYWVSSPNGAEVALLRAPAARGGSPYVISADEVDVATRGRDSFQREVHTILDSRRPASALVIGETFNLPGAWSSYPPHKHDVHDPPRQSKLQEIYHFRFDPPQGFGIQRIYSPERGVNEAFVVEDGDTVVIPYGYHPVVAGPGYRLYYLWALAGEGRELHLVEDPAHGWVARQP